MSFNSWWIARQYGLEKPHHGVRVHRAIPVPMTDGVVLVADHYAPDAPGEHPTLLMRSPYGRKGYGGLAEVYAERGFNVVLQACRGTEASGGEFDPLSNERADGLETLAWLREQPWFDGRLGLTGPSYLGYTQWAICDAPEVMALSTKVTSTDFRSVVFPSGAFNLGLGLGWMQIVEALKGAGWLMFVQMQTGMFERRTASAGMTLPLKQADEAAIGRRVGFWRRWFDEMLEEGPRWQAMDHRHRLGPTTPPNHFVSGWYDFMIDPLLRDYGALVEAGQRPYLTVGTWFHTGEALALDAPDQTLAWMRAQLGGDSSGLRAAPVRFHVSGRDSWHEAEVFPPGPAKELQVHLHSEGRLALDPAPASAPDRYTYDPADPTPNQGGAAFAFTDVGAVDNKARERRQDVLVFTGAVLAEPLTIVGNVGVTLYARAARPHADFFVRLCDVSPDGKSINICDGLVRVTDETPTGPDGCWRLEIALHATAHCFVPGRRLRVQVSSGAYPRYARNSGAGESIGTATRIWPNEIEIFHDPQHPTVLTLPTYAL